MTRFRASRLKIEWANEHINKINTLLVRFINTDFYLLSIEKDVKQGTNHLRFDFDLSAFPADEAALVIGDALHNLKSSLDILYNEVVAECGGTPDRYTRFPIRDTREALEAAMNGALKQKQISTNIHDFILDTVKPYKAWNYTLWALHDLNIMDKHQLLIPVLKLMRFGGISLEDDQHRPFFENQGCFMDEPGSIRLTGADDLNLAVKNKGHASAAILFDLGTPFECQPVVPALSGIAEEVTRTVEAFGLL